MMKQQPNNVSNPLYAHAYSSFRKQQQRGVSSLDSGHADNNMSGEQRRHVMLGGQAQRAQQQVHEPAQAMNGSVHNSSYAHRPSSQDLYPNIAQITAQRKQRIKSILLLSTLAFMGMIIFDGVVQFHPDLGSQVDKR